MTFTPHRRATPRAAPLRKATQRDDFVCPAATLRSATPRDAAQRPAAQHLATRHNAPLRTAALTS